MPTHTNTINTEFFTIRRAVMIMFASLVPGLGHAAPDDGTTPNVQNAPATPSTIFTPGLPPTPNTYLSPSTPIDPSTHLTPNTPIAPSATVSSGDALNFAVGGSIAHDDNLFRLPSSAPTPNIRNTSSKSDVLTTIYAGVRIDKPYAMQRFLVDLTAIQYNYKSHSYLDFSTVNYRTAWLWAVSPRADGCFVGR